MQFIGLIVISVYIIILFMTWGFFHYKNSSANNSIVITLGFSILDTITDVLSTIELHTLDSTLYIATIFFIVLPISINFIISLAVVYKLLKENTNIILPRITTYAGKKIELTHPSFHRSFSGEIQPMTTAREWFKKNYILCTFVVMFSSFNVENLAILSSRVFGSNVLKINWPDRYEEGIRILGIISNVLEDIPQLIIQLSYIAGNYNSIQDVPNILFVSVISSFLSIIFSVIKRGLLFMLNIVDKVDKKPQINNKEEEISNKKTYPLTTTSSAPSRIQTTKTITKASSVSSVSSV